MVSYHYSLTILSAVGCLIGFQFRSGHCDELRSTLVQIVIRAQERCRHIFAESWGHERTPWPEETVVGQRERGRSRVKRLSIRVLPFPRIQSVNQRLQGSNSFR